MLNLDTIPEASLTATQRAALAKRGNGPGSDPNVIDCANVVDAVIGGTVKVLLFMVTNFHGLGRNFSWLILEFVGSKPPS